MKSPDIEKAVLMYYEKTEIGNAEIMELFGVSRQTACKLKNEVLKEMAKNNIRCWLPKHVNTAVAFKTWGIDIDDYEKRLKKLRTLKGA